MNTTVLRPQVKTDKKKGAANIVCVYDSSRGDICLDLNHENYVATFTSIDGRRYVAHLGMQQYLDAPTAYERVIDGQLRRFDIYPVDNLSVDGVVVDEVIAVGFSSHINRLILLRLAANIVGGVQLVSRPISPIYYRAIGKHKSSVAISEVAIAVSQA